MTQHRDVSLAKIGYMMSRIGGDDELTPDDLETLINKVFVASFEYEHGFEADLIKALVDARYVLRCHDGTGNDDPATLSGEEAEKWYLNCQKRLYMKAGCNDSYAEESASWPDSLPLNADWDDELLEQLANTEVAHHLVVMEQIRAEMEKRKTNE
jgi:hypothetical protein